MRALVFTALYPLSVAQGVEHEAHHLTMRTTRHLKTIKSTHYRTMFYYLGIYTAIVGASFLQARLPRAMY